MAEQFGSSIATVPPGGTSGQALVKVSNFDFDYGWADPTGGSSWGTITGTLSDQTDLQAILDNKQPLSSVLTGTTASFTTALETKLNGIATGATVGADWSVNLINIPAVISGTTASFTTALETKLNGIASGATVGATWGSNISGQPSIVSQAEAEAGTATTERIWTAQRVAQAIAALASSGSFDGNVTGLFRLSGDITPGTITSNQNNYNPTGLATASVLRLSSDQPRSITGIAAQSDGSLLTIINVSSTVDGEIILRAENSNSTAANRFDFDVDIVLEPTESLTIIYDSTASRWKRFAARRYSGSTFRRNPYWVTDFLGVPGGSAASANVFWNTVLINSGTQGSSVGEPNHPGILRLISSTTANSGVRVTTAAWAIRLGGGEVAEFVFTCPTLTNTTVRMGFIDTTTSSDCVDGAYIEMQPGGTCVGKTANNSTRTTSSTITTLSASTWYIARIVVRKDLSGVDFYIFDDNGNLLGSQSNTTNIPTSSGRETGHGVVATNSGTTAVDVLWLDFMSLEFTRALV